MTGLHGETGTERHDVVHVIDQTKTLQASRVARFVARCMGGAHRGAALTLRSELPATPRNTGAIGLYLLYHQTAEGCKKEGCHLRHHRHPAT
jgi:hypothetical protein